MTKKKSVSNKLFDVFVIILLVIIGIKFVMFIWSNIILFVLIGLSILIYYDDLKKELKSKSKSR